MRIGEGPNRGRKAVLGMLADVPDWSDRAIAKHVEVSHPFVATQRASLVTDSSETPDERTYTTKHGTTATMNVSGQNMTGQEKVKKAASAAKQGKRPANPS